MYHSAELIFTYYTGLLKRIQMKKYKVILSNQPHIYDFCLQLPTTRPLPSSMSKTNARVTYIIKVYKRSKEGYDVFMRKVITYYGFHGINGGEETESLSMLQVDVSGVRQPLRNLMTVIVSLLQT